jgi:hypothetical protein
MAPMARALARAPPIDLTLSPPPSPALQLAAAPPSASLSPPRFPASPLRPPPRFSSDSDSDAAPESPLSRPPHSS